MVAVMLTYKMVSPFYIDPYDINGKFRLYFNCPILLLELCAPANFEAQSSLLQNRLHPQIQIPNAYPASEIVPGNNTDGICNPFITVDSVGSLIFLYTCMNGTGSL